MAKTKKIQPIEMPNNQDLVKPPAIQRKKKSPLREFIETIIIVIALVVSVNYFVVQGFYIPSGSMRTTLLEGDRILVNKFIYKFGDPHRGDVIVFKFPSNMKETLVKRVIGLPGDTVELTGGAMYVNSKKLKEPYVQVNMQGEFGPKKVPFDQYFVMGDNRNISDDSRYWGTLPRKDILGKAFVIYYPFNRFSVLDDYHN